MLSPITRRGIFFLNNKENGELIAQGAFPPFPFREGRRELYMGMDIIPFMGTRGLFYFYFYFLPPLTNAETHL